jgi:hypothetical protein
LAVDGTGNLYIADSGNFRVRMVDTNGIITTVAGNGSGGAIGDGGPATAARLAADDVALDAAGNIYIASSGRIRMVSVAKRYYRHTSISHTTQPIACQPVYLWYGYSCSAGSITRTASAGTSAFGANGGVGFTIRFSETRWRFYIESRYNYTPNAHVATTLIPTTFGIMYQ